MSRVLCQLRDAVLLLAITVGGVQAAELGPTTLPLAQFDALMKFRPILLALGWKPVETYVQNSNGLEHSDGLAGKLFEGGFGEVEFCWGHDACILNYVKDGACLRLTTQGDYNKYGDLPLLVRWSAECPKAPTEAGVVDAPPPVVIGQTLAEADSALSEDGWKPVDQYHVENLADVDSSGYSYWYRQGYRGLDDCYGADFLACSFNYVKGDRCFRITVLGERAAKLISWSFRCYEPRVPY